MCHLTGGGFVDDEMIEGVVLNLFAKGDEIISSPC